jgi:hypothetical protein
MIASFLPMLVPQDPYSRDSAGLAVNEIGDAGTERLAGVLAQCPALFRLNLSSQSCSQWHDASYSLSSGLTCNHCSHSFFRVDLQPLFT